MPTTTTTTLSYSSDTYVLTVSMTTNPVTVAVHQARDAYQIAQAEGFTGTRTEWLDSLIGPQGPTGATGPQGSAADVVICADLAAYLALAPEVQMDGRFYIVPTA